MFRTILYARLRYASAVLYKTGRLTVPALRQLGRQSLLVATRMPQWTWWFLRHLVTGLMVRSWRAIDLMTDLRVLVALAAVTLVVQELRPHSTTDALVHVVWTEARGEGQVGQEAIVWSVYNRFEAQQPYWGTRDIEAVVYNRRGKDNELCEYDGVCVMPSMRTVRYTTAWWRVAMLVVGTRLKIALGFSDPTGGAHSYATVPVYLKSGYHQKLCNAVIVGRHIFGTDPETGQCHRSAAPQTLSLLPPRRPSHSG